MENDGGGGSEKAVTQILAPFKYDLLPLGDVKPRGWMKDQLEAQAARFPGHIFDFYRYVKHSAWMGGQSEYSELNEAAPYWYNGIVPLAYILDDERLKSQANQFLHYVLSHQASDGWLGPETRRETRGIWATCLLLQGMMNNAIADSNQLKNIVESMLRFTELAHIMLKDDYKGFIPQAGDTFDPFKFGVARAHELSTSLQWLYDEHPNGKAAIIWETMELMFADAKVAGRDWSKFFIKGVFPEKPSTMPALNFQHGVNLAQGSIIADEYLGGLSTQRGSELCMAVEMMYSMSYLYRLMGDNCFADQAELAAYNALPVAISADWWSHQYVTQTNQPWSRDLKDQPYYNVVSRGNVFGLEPNFPCCLVNVGQAYPKFFMSSFVRQSETCLIHQFLVPASVETTVNCGSVKVTCDTLYPFGQVLKYSITSQKPFNFLFRVPEWASTSSTITRDGAIQPLTPNEDNLQKVSLDAGLSPVEVILGLNIRVVPRPNNSVAIYRGALQFALDIEYESASQPALSWDNQKPLPSGETHPFVCDHELSPLSTSPWAVAINPEQMVVHDQSSSVDIIANPIFERGAPPVYINVAANRIEWPQTNGTADLPPENPVLIGKPFVAKLVPYGSAKLHIAELPSLSFKRVENL